MSAAILVVDDNPASLKLVRLLLAGEGYEVHTASDGEAALAVLRDVRPRLVMLDIQLPRLDGLEVARRVKADPATRDTVVIAMTAYAGEADERRARAAGCDEFLTKPIDTRAVPLLVSRRLTEGA